MNTNGQLETGATNLYPLRGVAPDLHPPLEGQFPAPTPHWRGLLLVFLIYSICISYINKTARTLTLTLTFYIVYDIIYVFYFYSEETTP